MDATKIETDEEKNPAIKYFVQIKTLASNIMTAFDALDSFTDDWPDEGNLKNTALDIHLRCESASNECQGIINTLDALGDPENKTPSPFPEEFMTMEVRYEYAQGKLNQIKALLEGVETGFPSTEAQIELGIEEMKTRVGAIEEEIAEMKTGVDNFKGHVDGITLKWQTQSINECIHTLKSVVDKLAEEVGISQV